MNCLILKKNAVFLFFLFFLFFYVFFTFRPWLTNQCIATVTADLNGHYSNFRAFANQFYTYHWIYPLDFTLDNNGTFWFYLLPLSYLGPTLLTFFFTPDFSFFFFYILTYAFLVLSVYILLRNFCNQLTAILFSGFLLVGPSLNLNFTVGGNYHFFVALPFFFLSMHFFFQLYQKFTRRSLLCFSITYLLLGITHVYPFLYLTLFIIFFSLYRRLYPFLLYFFLLAGILSLFFVPVAIQQLNLTTVGSQSSITLHSILKNHIFSTTLTSWIYSKNLNYDVHRDQNYGPHMFIFGALSLLLLIFFYKDKSESFKFILFYFLVMLLIVLLPPLPLLFKHPERLMTHMYYAVFLLSAYLFSKFKLNIYALLGIITLFAFFVKDAFFTSRFFWFTFLVIPILIYYHYKEKNNFTYTLSPLSIIFSAIFLFLLLVPLTGVTDTTALDPRLNHFVLSGIENFITPSDTFYYQGGFSFNSIIRGCTLAHDIIGAHTAYSFDNQISGIEEVDVYTPTDRTLAQLNFRQVNKLVVPVELIQTGGTLNLTKISHIFAWFGQPSVFVSQFFMYDHYGNILGKIPYPLLIFSRNLPLLDYNRTMINPTRFLITKRSDIDSLHLNIEYSKLWNAFTSAHKKIVLKNKDGSLYAEGLRGINQFTIEFSRFPFYLGCILSFFSLILVVFFYRKYDHLPTTWKPHAWYTFLKNSLSNIWKKKTL